jgi:hypothetical protein
MESFSPAAPSPTRFLSYESAYSDHRPHQVFFQNFFCSRLNVSVTYPFQHPFLQHHLERTQYPISLLNKVVDLLIQERRCGLLFPLKRTQRITFDYSFDHELPHLLSPETTSPLLPKLLSLHHTIPQLEILHFNHLPTNSVRLLNKLTHAVNRMMLASSSSFSSSAPHRPLEIILLLVTESYAEIFQNFLCYLDKLPTLSSRLFLTITPHDLIEDLAVKHSQTAFKVADQDIASLFPYLPLRELRLLFNAHGSDYGKILYQQLIYLRSVTAHYLLTYFNHHVLIADVDTIWVTDPLLLHPEGGQGDQTDLRVTFDGPEQICGCYLYLYPTHNTRFFWNDIITRHASLIYHSYLLTQSAGEGLGGMMNEFEESEQLLITQILLVEREQGVYPVPLNIHVQERESFPSGNDFFVTGLASRVSSLHSSPPPLAIIHNNFIVGVQFKKIRFQRHNLWRVGYPTSPNNITTSTNTPTSLMMCVEPETDQTLQVWRAVLSLKYLSREIIPNLILLSPVHNSLTSSDKLFVVLFVERNTNLPPPSPAPLENQKGHVWLSRSPNLTGFSFYHGSLILGLVINQNLFHFSVTLEHTNLNLVGDVCVNGNSALLEVYNQVNPLLVKDSLINYFQSVHTHLRVEKYQRVSTSPSSALSQTLTGSAVEVLKEEKCPFNHEIVSAVSVHFSIKVLTFTRERSLERLLLSLLSADYGDHQHRIELCIHVDYPNEHTTTLEQVSQIIPS